MSIKKIILLIFSICIISSAYAKEYSLYAYVEKGTPKYTLIKETIKKFESMHKGTTIKLDIASDQAYHTKLQVLAVGRKLPDLMTIWAGSRTEYVTGKGLIANLKPFINKSVRKTFIASALSSQDKKGNIYQIPENLTLTGVVYANNSLLKKLNLTFPKTYKSWLKQVKVIQKAGYTALAVGNKSPWVMQSIVLSAILGKTAGDKWLDKAVSGKASFKDKPFVKALEIIKEMYDKGLLDKATPNWSYNQGANEFLAGRAVYAMDGGWIINNYIKNADKNTLKNISLHTFPKVANEKTKNSTSGILGTGIGIKNSLSRKEKKLLFDFVKLYAGDKMVTERVKIGLVPLVKKVKFPSDTNKLVKDLSKLTKSSKITYVFDGIMDPESVGILQNLMQEMLLGSKNAKEVAKEFEAFVKKNSKMRK